MKKLFTIVLLMWGVLGANASFGTKKHLISEVYVLTAHNKATNQRTLSISGQVLGMVSKKPIRAKVHFFELKGKRRTTKVRTTKDGKFTFVNIDPTVPIQLIAQSTGAKEPPMITLDTDQIRYANVTLEYKQGCGGYYLTSDDDIDGMRQAPNTGLNFSQMNLFKKHKTMHDQPLNVTKLTPREMSNFYGEHKRANLAVVIPKDKQYLVNGVPITDPEVLRHLDPQEISSIFEKRSTGNTLLTGKVLIKTSTSFDLSLISRLQMRNLALVYISPH